MRDLDGRTSAARHGLADRRSRRTLLAAKLFGLVLIVSGSISTVSALQPSRPAPGKSSTSPALAKPAMAADAQAYAGPQDDGPITTSHGYAVFGKLKYGPGWKHLDYVNPDAPKGGIYRFAQPGTYDSMNNFAVLGFAPFMLSFIYDSLLQRSLDEPASYYGLVAETISYPKSIAWAEFKMRPEARFHDGTPITPEDVIFTVKAFGGLVAPSYRRIAQSIAKIQKTGPHSVRVTFVQKNNPTMPSIVAQMPILPKHYFEKRDLSKQTLDRPLASGPYKVGKFAAGRWIEVERVKDYWARDLPINKGRYNFDIVRHDFYRDASVQQQVFLTGQSDLRSEASAVRWASEDRLPAFKAHNIVRADIPYSNGSYYQCITLNTRVPALSDRRVRKAIMLAYDNEWVVRTLLAGHHGRLRSYFDNTPFSSANSLPSAEELKLLVPYRKQLPAELFTSPPQLPVGGTWNRRRNNLVEATGLLRQAGYRYQGGVLIDPRTNRPLTLNLMAGSVLSDRQVYLFIQNMRELGIFVQFRSFDSAAYRNRQRNYDYDMILTGPVFAPLAAPGLEMLQAWSSKAATTPGSTNYAGIRNPVIDALLDTLIKARERGTVVAAMRAIDRVAMWNYYSVPFQHSFPAPIGHNPIAYWDKFGRPKVEPTYYFPYMLMEHWWVDKAKEAKLRYGVYGQRR